jgi:bifunctional non-homologous end joining protein LigD
MALKEYKEKRNFKETPEPSKKGASSKEGGLAFVVQLHDASHLHYDFRLEVNGVLKSWAVPKGPSLNPADKRLAIMVEDHPFDYRKFEGTIPEGNYGAGKVIVWDEGTYSPLGATSRKESEKLMNAMLEKGHIKIMMHGHKLKGEFSLVRMNNTDNQWLLVKKEDEFATTDDIREKNKSVLSSRSIDPHLEKYAEKAEKKSPQKARSKVKLPPKANL